MPESTPATLSPDTKLFHDVFNASPIGIAVENLEGQPLFVNPAFCSFLGFSEEEMRIKHCVDFSPPEDAQRDWELFQKLKGGLIDRYQLEKRYFRRDGSLVWGRLSLSLLNSRPSPLVIAMVADITEKKTAEEAVRESEERLRLVNERLHLAIEAGAAGGWDWDVKNEKNFWFGKAHALLGLAVDECSGALHEFWDRVHPEDRGRLETAICSARLNHTEFTEEFRVIWPNGAVRWLRSRGKCYYDVNGTPERMLGISVDITDRKLADEARFRHAAIVESSEDAIVSKNLDGTITSWNAGAQRIYGYTEAEAIGKPISILVPPEIGDQEGRILERLRAGERIEHYETIRLTKAGKRVNVSLSLSPIRDSSGTILGLSGIARDITPRKEA
jgi:PAS domain S-box-containing protein